MAPKTTEKKEGKSLFIIPHEIMLKFEPRRCRKDEVAELGNVQHGQWSVEEHDAFINALKLYPMDSWCTIATEVNTRTPRQCSNHFQKIRRRMERNRRISNSFPTLFNGSLDGVSNTPTTPQKVHKKRGPVSEIAPIIKKRCTNRENVSKTFGVSATSTHEVKQETPIQEKSLVLTLSDSMILECISPITFPLDTPQENNWKDDDIMQWFCEVFS